MVLCKFGIVVFWCFTFWCCVYNERRSWGDFSSQLGGVVPCGNDSWLQCWGKFAGCVYSFGNLSHLSGRTSKLMSQPMPKGRQHIYCSTQISVYIYICVCVFAYRIFRDSSLAPMVEKGSRNSRSRATKLQFMESCRHSIVYQTITQWYTVFKKSPHKAGGRKFPAERNVLLLE